MEKQIEEHVCDSCIYYSKSWGCCDLEPFILDDGYNLTNLPKWKPKYKGKKCPKYIEKKIN